MDPRLLRYYKEELEFVREMGAEFAAAYPKIAGRLGITGLEVADPYVERLLEGFAFLTARVQMKIDAEFPRFTSALLEGLFPNYLAPVPSMAILQVHPNGEEPALMAGVGLPRGTPLKSLFGKGEQTTCEYRTSQPLQLWPLQIVGAQYVGSPRDMATLSLPPVGGVRAGLRVRIATTGKATWGNLPIRSLPLYLQGPEDVPVLLMEQLLANLVAVVLRPAGTPGSTPPWQVQLDQDSVRLLGCTDDEALLPAAPRTFQGHRLLQEYFAFPERLRLVELSSIDQAAAQAGDARELDVFFLFDRSVSRLENNVDETRFALFCVPAVNLFVKRCDRIHLEPTKSEYHVVPDRSRPLDFEIHSLLEVTGHGTAKGEEQLFRPLYGTDDFAMPVTDARYYTIDRRQRLQGESSKQSGRRSAYLGGDVFVTLVDSVKPPHDPDLMQLAVLALCSNRDLPLQMPLGLGSSDFTIAAAAPVTGVRCIAGPTRPRPSIAYGDRAWRLIDQLGLNYHSLVGGDDRQGEVALRELLGLYAESSERQVQKQIQGVHSVQCEPVTRRLPTSGPLAFGRGLMITVTCEESQFEGSGVFPLGCVLEKFFARCVSLNSFTETVLCTVERGEVARWPPRIGSRQLL